MPRDSSSGNAVSTWQERMALICTAVSVISAIVAASDHNEMGFWGYANAAIWSLNYYIKGK